MLYFESGNYFNPDSSAKPLLHLWSLGVEEQFYVIFPVFLWVLYRLNLNFALSLAIFTITSFILCKNGIKHHNQPTAFYLPWCRFWELSIGALLAYIVEYHKELIKKIKIFTKEFLIPKICLRDSNIVIKDSTLNNILSVIGLFLIIIGIFSIKQNLKFPGTKALIPVFGAFFIIAAGKDAFINKKILSNRILVFFGLISYPLYLWHWPLLSFAYICENFEPNEWVKISAIIFAIILSVITYYLIETPLRYGRNKLFCVFFLFISINVIGIIALYIFLTMKEYFFKEELNNSKLVSELIIREKNCNSLFKKWNTVSDNPDYWHHVTSCKVSTKDDEIAFIGDSHAGSYYLGIANKFANRKVSVFPKANAAPFYNVRTGARNAESSRENYIYINEALDFIRRNNNYKVVVLAHTPLASYNDTKYMGIDKVLPYTEDNSFTILKIAVKDTVDKLLDADKKVIFTLDNPKLPESKTNCVYRPITINYKPKCEFDKEFYINTIEIQEYNKFIRNLIKTDYPNGNVDYVDLAKILCDETKCYEGINNKALYKDQNHLNQEGSNLVAPKIIQKIDKMLAN